MPEEIRGGRQSAAPELTPREIATQARIKELRMRLLDLTNANRLLNYKFSDRSRRQIRLVDERPDALMEHLEDDKRLTFKPLPELTDEPKDEQEETFVVALEQATRSRPAGSPIAARPSHRPVPSTSGQGWRSRAGR